MKNTILKFAAFNALATVFYIALVALFLFYVAPIIGPSRTPLIPIMMLSLFVFSATITGLLILGRPVLWYLDGKKKEAVSLLVATLGVLFVVMVATFSVLVLFIQK